MTRPVRKLSISVPPDVAERLEREPNASAYLVEAARALMRREALTAELAHQGIQVTEEGVARARAARAAVDAAWPPERYQAVRERVRHAVDNEVTGSSQAPAA
ncbi:hypothetical protein U2F26_12885 [Micromonospora sp. 4G57]|uniref:CopG family transcriptional regulator n=1 Tax=Micromonospora sicca TaxID=2202420 RepID=A0ABU5J8J3_9ACTN|nr:MULTISPECIES: hypothetical protein [unclassified Micromonospora]MDZ5443622.1 hypothetical protein [Micromonospora sp. 4G57]MDZ5488906.1 hypothetical protein [Micromonospora sp. 4G53]